MVSVYDFYNSPAALEASMLTIHGLSLVTWQGWPDRCRIGYLESSTTVDVCILTGAKLSHFGDGLYTTHKNGDLGDGLTGLWLF